MYSFYHEGQGGLGLADVDRDGRLDIFCGNYWVQAPQTFDLHWRLFAINTWYETENSPAMHLVVRGSRVWVTQRDMDPARLSVFERPADPKQLWPEKRLSDDLHRPGGLAVADFDGDGADDVAVAESAGPARLMVYAAGAGTVVVQGKEIRGLYADGRDLLAVTVRGLTRFVNQGLGASGNSIVAYRKR
jgi:hypothetical protein